MADEERAVAVAVLDREHPLREMVEKLSELLRPHGLELEYEEVGGSPPEVRVRERAPEPPRGGILGPEDMVAFVLSS